MDLDPKHIVPWSSDWLWSLPLSVAAVVIYSLNAMTTLGHSGSDLERHWQLVGALEALNGLLLFGLSTAFLFAIIQEAWARLGRQPLRRTGLTT